jgi:hypothetical protein
MIKEGDICIWQNLGDNYTVQGQLYDGLECTAMSGLVMVSCNNGIGQSIGERLCYKTDTVVHTPFGSGPVIAKPHQLRLKNPPKEDKEIEEPQKIIDLVGLV